MKNAVSRDFIELVVEYPEVCCYPEYKGKPYYSIKYLENGKDIVVGFGTYNPKVLSEYLKEYFILPIQTQPKTGHWISVSERLPEQYKEVIVTDIETTDTYLSRYIGNGHWECDNGLFDNRIIAWMPLPAPYKPQEREVEEC